MKVTICDRCGDLLEADVLPIKIDFDQVVKAAHNPILQPSLDLCPDCFEEIRRWLEGYAFEVKDMRKVAKP